MQKCKESRIQYHSFCLSSCQYACLTFSSFFL
uniref:Uncharacterized protein n=1 Tax=Rhizophora mucronata TaxID=61149 RepID=A0A2P2PN64_RHIMU